MPSQKPLNSQSKSALRVAADALRKLALQHSDGDFVGSEAELIEKLGVSRPTFRQVAKLLEQEQLLSIRRGVGGGFFAQRPSSRGVAHMAAIFLRSRGSTQGDAIRAARPLFVECAQLAAHSSSDLVRQKVTAFLQRERTGEQHLSEFVRREREFALIVAEAADNPVLELFIQVLADYFSSFLQRSAYDGHPERVEVMGRLRSTTMQAILDQDQDVAQIMAGRRYDNLIGWLADSQLEQSEKTPISLTDGIVSSGAGKSSIVSSKCAQHAR